MGRAPCCDKANVKKGPWSPEEDDKLKAYIEHHGTGGNWIALPQKIGLKRCGKSCRLRWLNYLRPNIRHGGFSEEEDDIICSLFINIGSRWSIIAGQLPGRTDNDIKNYWNTKLKKKLLGKQRKEQQAQARRANSLKQQEMMKREGENFMVPVVINQSAYWSSELPIAMPVAAAAATPMIVQDPHLKDQATLQNLLIKLNTAAAAAATNFQYPIDIISSSPQDQIYANSMSVFTSSAAMNSINVTTSSQLPNMFQGLQNFPAELRELGYDQNPQQLSSLEGFYGVDMVNASNGSGTTSASTPGDSACWGDISSLVFPPLVSDYEVCQQESAFQDLRYFVPQ